MGSGHIMFSNLQCGSFLQLYRTSPVVGSGTCVIYKADEAKFNFHLKRVYTFNNKSGDLLEVHFRLRPAAPFSKLSVTLQDQNPIFKSKYNNKRAGPSQQTEKESCCLVFVSSTKREIRHYHVVVVQRRLKNEQKRVMHVQSCCFANLNLLLFFPFSLPSPSPLLKHPGTNSISGLDKYQILRETRPLFYGRLQFVESPDVVTPTHVSDQQAESLDVIF